MKEKQERRNEKIRQMEKRLEEDAAGTRHQDDQEQAAGEPGANDNNESDSGTEVQVEEVREEMR